MGGGPYIHIYIYIEGLNSGYIGIMEKRMEAIRYSGVYGR